MILRTLVILCSVLTIAAAQTPKGQWDKRFCPCGIYPDIAVSWPVVREGDKLYISGSFDSTIGGYNAFLQGRRVPGLPLVWDGKEYSVLGGGVGSMHYTGGKWHHVSHTIVAGDSVIVLGFFESVGNDIPAKYVAFWNKKTETWDIPPPMPFEGSFYHAVADRNDLFLAGNFQDSNYEDRATVIRYNFKERKWYDLGKFTSERTFIIHDLVINEQNLFLAGVFRNLDGAESPSYNNVARWERNEQKWFPLDTLEPSGTSKLSVISMVAGNGDSLYAIRQAPTTSSVDLWNGIEWRSLGVANALKLVKDGPDLYVLGGVFTSEVDSFFAVARWDGNGWIESFAPFKEEDAPFSINWPQCTVIDGILYDYQLNRFNGKYMIPIDSGTCYGINGRVTGMTIHNDTLYVAGLFSYAGGVPAPGAAFWDGSNWYPIGDLLTTEPYSHAGTFDKLIMYHNSLYATDSYSPLLKRWTGSIWEIVGEEDSNKFFGRYIRDLAIYRDTLIVGGYYDHQHSYAKLGKWDGERWSFFEGDTMSLATVGGDGVNALAARGNDLYIAGGFGTHRGDTVNGIVQWNGDSWLPVLTDGFVGLPKGSIYHMDFMDSSLVLVGRYLENGVGTTALMELTSNGLKHLLPPGKASVLDGPMTLANGYVFLGEYTDNERYAPAMIDLSGSVFSIGNIATEYSGNDEKIYSIANDGKGRLYIGGAFDHIAGTPSFNFGIWTQSPASVHSDNTNTRNGDITLSPNPASSTLMVYLPDALSLRTITMTDALGRIISTVISSEKVLRYDTSELPNGFYSIVIASDASHELVKFTVRH